MNKKIKNFDIVSKYKIWLIVPLVVLIFSLIMFGVFAGVYKNVQQGIAIGVEFQGGTALSVKLGEDKVGGAQYQENKNKIEKIISKNKGYMNYVQVSGQDVLVFKYALPSNLNAEQLKEINDNIVSQIQEAYPEIYATNTQFVSAKYIGPTASRKLVNTALISILISTLLILLYILIRFELFSAISAVIALVVDVLHMFLMMIIFHVQINSTFIAAVITIVAYSINNTIVVFDRVRENYKLLDLTKYDDRYIVNMSVRDTLARSIATTATTLFSIVIFAILGVSSIREFALPVIFGLFSGLFTSVCLAPSIFVLLKERYMKKHGNKVVGFKNK